MGKALRVKAVPVAEPRIYSSFIEIIIFMLNIEFFPITFILLISYV